LTRCQRDPSEEVVIEEKLAPFRYEEIPGFRKAALRDVVWLVVLLKAIEHQ